MKKIDFKKTMKTLYDAPRGRFAKIDVPKLRYIMIDGEGNPNSVPSYKTAVEWLFSISYAMKFAAKRELERDYVVPPLEGLWWADSPADCASQCGSRARAATSKSWFSGAIGLTAVSSG